MCASIIIIKKLSKQNVQIPFITHATSKLERNRKTIKEVLETESNQAFA